MQVTNNTTTPPLSAAAQATKQRLEAGPYGFTPPSWRLELQDHPMEEMLAKVNFRNCSASERGTLGMYLADRGAIDDSEWFAIGERSMVPDYCDPKTFDDDTKVDFIDYLESSISYLKSDDPGNLLTIAYMEKTLAVCNHLQSMRGDLPSPSAKTMATASAQPGTPSVGQPRPAWAEAVLQAYQQNVSRAHTPSQSDALLEALLGQLHRDNALKKPV